MAVVFSALQASEMSTAKRLCHNLDWPLRGI